MTRFCFSGFMLLLWTWAGCFCSVTQFCKSGVRCCGSISYISTVRSITWEGQPVFYCSFSSFCVTLFILKYVSLRGGHSFDVATYRPNALDPVFFFLFYYDWCLLVVYFSQSFHFFVRILLWSSAIMLSSSICFVTRKQVFGIFFFSSTKNPNDCVYTIQFCIFCKYNLSRFFLYKSK